MRLRLNPPYASGGPTATRLKAVLGLVLVCLGAPGSRGATAIRPATGITSLGPQSVSFEANIGQAGDSARFIARGPAYYFSLSPTEATISLRKFDAAPTPARSVKGRARDDAAVSFRSVRLEFLGANPLAEISGESELPGRVNYFLGSDAAKWRTGVPLFSRVRVTDMYPGISLLHYGNQQHLEYDFEVAPEANPSAIALRFSGADRLTIDPQGDLILSLGADEIRQPKPVIYQQVGQQRKEIWGGYVLTDPQTVKFEIGDYDPHLALVIDPVLSYSTYYGGSGRDTAWGVAVDANGFVYVAGETMAGLPTTTGTPTNQYGGTGTGLHGDAFVAKFDRSFSNVIFLTYIGGGFDDVARSVVVDAGGSAYITGYTCSPDFPQANAIFSQLSGTPYPGTDIYPLDAFVTKLGPSGTNLVYSTFLGGNGADVGLGITVDPAGHTYVAGYTQSTNFPTANVTGTFTNYSGGVEQNDDAFVTKLGPYGTNLIYSMFLGGTNVEWAKDITADAGGVAYLTGFSASTNFPVTANATQPWLAGGQDAFVTVVGPFGNLITSTYLGGVGTNQGYRITLDADSNIYVTGVTEEDSAFPTTASLINPGGAFQSSNGGVTWSAANNGLQSVLVASLAVDPANPARVYAGTARGIARSSNGGATWNPAVNVAPMARLSSLGPTIAIGLVLSIAIDPLTPTTLYAGTGQGVFKSLDAGANWFLNNTNLNTSSTRALVVDPITPSILYSGGEFGIYRSTNGATNWQSVNNSLGNQTVRALAVHPVTPTTLYAATAGGVYRSTNSGTNWAAFNSGLGNLSAQAMAIDPVNPATLYVGTAAGVYKSINGGTNWSAFSVGLTTSNVSALVLNPLTPATLYAGTTNGLFKSADAGLTWVSRTNGFVIVDFLALALNPASPDTVYAGTRGNNFYGGNDVFVTKLGVNGFSAVFGGSGDEEGWDVAVGTSGRVHVVGSTASVNFPTLNTSGFLSATNSGSRDVLYSELSQDGGRLLSSAYLGGSAVDYGNGIALDGSGSVYLVGETSSGNFPTLGALQGTYRGSKDAFIARIANIVPDPVLFIQSVSNQVRLSWSAAAGDYHLQSNTNLLFPNGWVDVPGTPVESNGVLSLLSLPATNTARFFRLANP
jgi:hypothetical protein